MAIRKLRKQMKPLILLFVSAFMLTIIGGMVAYVYSYKASQKQQLALKLNGEKLNYIKFERAFSNGVDSYRRNYGNKIDVETSKMIIFNDVIEQELLLQEAKNLKVKVSSKAVKEEYNKIQSQFGSKKQFKMALKAQGYTQDALKKDLKSNLLVEQVRKKIEEQAKVTDEQVKAYYDENKYSAYLGKKFETEKEAIRKKLENTEKRKTYNAYIEKLMNTAKYEDVKATYKPYLYSIKLEEKGFKLSNLEVSKRSIFQKLYGITDNEQAEKNIVEAFKKQVKIAEVAIKKGAKLNKDLATDDQIDDLREQLTKILKKEYVINENDVKFYFASNKSKYETQEEADIQIIDFELKPTTEDKEEAKIKAEKILKEVKEKVKNVSDFAELAKKYSDGPSAPVGGQLNWFGKGQMIEEFQEAAFAGKKGAVIDKLVKTQYGYHIIYVEDKKTENDKEMVKASHILIQEKPGEAAKKEALKKAENVLSKLKNNEIKFEDAAKVNSKLKNSKVEKIMKNGYIPGIGLNKELSEKIFKSELNKYVLYNKEKVVIFKKVRYVPFKEANYDEQKNRINEDFLRENINKQIVDLIKDEK